MPEVKTKQTFGGSDAAQMLPTPTDGVPLAMNVIIYFEEALKLRT